MPNFATPWAVACQAPLSVGFLRQEDWSGSLFPSPGALPHPGIKPESSASPALQADSLPLSYQGSPYPVSNHHIVQFKYLTALFVNDTSVKLGQGGSEGKEV